MLDAAVLALVRRADGYGYDVVRRLRSAGLTDVGDASVYGTLRRLYRGGAPDPNRRPVFAKTGKRLSNAFPIRSFDPDTHRVAHPNAMPHGLNPKPLRQPNACIARMRFIASSAATL